MKKILALLTVAASLMVGVLNPVNVMAAGPYNTSMIVMPHPDDEIEAWSLIENSPANYKVFVYLTQGEQTTYCEPDLYQKSFEPHYGEVAPAATPLGKWTNSCTTARISSTLGYMNKMAHYDETIPNGFSLNDYTTVTLPNPNGYGHIDSTNNANPVISDGTVRVYTGDNGYGKILFFNLGDGDLTQQEVEWAVSSVMANRSLFDLPSYPFYNAIGNFYNKNYSNCAVYSHPDHLAVHKALYYRNFGFTAYQTAATCETDPDTVRTRNVTWVPWSHAMLVRNDGTRYGYLQKYYGWLRYVEANPAGGWPYDGSLTTQNKTFMRHQSFWQRF